MFCLSQIILSFEPSVINQEILSGKFRFLLLKISEVLASPETIFLHSKNEQELAEWQLFLSRCGMATLFPTVLHSVGFNHVCYHLAPIGILQPLLQSLRSQLPPSELLLDFFCNSHLIAIYFTGLEDLVREKTLNLKLINHIYTRKILLCSLF